MTDAEKLRMDLLTKAVRMMGEALRETPEGAAALGRVVMRTPEGVAVLSALLNMQKSGEI